MDSKVLTQAVGFIKDEMVRQRDYLVELDQQNGDGDLGISMANGYTALYDFMEGSDIRDLGQILMKGAAAFNQAAPSSLGTITAFGLMGMASVLKGKEEADLPQLVEALEGGLAKIMEKAKSKPGEKTILDALYPGIESLKENKEKPALEAFREAAQKAEEGSLSTRDMLSVHGRAAYYGEKSLGVLDGGSVVGSLIFKSIVDYLSQDE